MALQGCGGSPHCVTSNNSGDSWLRSSPIFTLPGPTFPLAVLGGNLSVLRRAWLVKGLLCPNLPGAQGFTPGAQSCPEPRMLNSSGSGLEEEHIIALFFRKKCSNLTDIFPEICGNCNSGVEVLQTSCFACSLLPPAYLRT